MDSVQLAVTVPPGQTRTYLLTKPELVIGRFPTCDVVLADPACSRIHARLCNTPQGLEIEDQGSTNATLLNGLPVKRSRLMVGDTITIGESTLQVQPLGQAAAAECVPENLSELTRALSQQTMEIQLTDTSQARLAIQTRTRVWEVTLGQDETTIGRDWNCQVVIQDPSVSRQHARVVREGNGYVLMDLNSRNGTWQNRQRVTRHVLRPGDMFQIGDATLVYKGPIDQESATLMLDRPLTPHRGARRPVVFVPGFMGSELWLGSEQIWPNVTAMFSHTDMYRYKEDSGITAPRLVNDMIIVPNLIKLERHDALGNFLCEGMGYELGKDFLEFPYDWRCDLRVSARLLAERIAAWREQVPEAEGPITLICHSMGCLIGRYFVEVLGGRSIVNRMILIGGPHLGTCKTLQVFAGFGKQPIYYCVAEPFQRVIASFPASYFMLPDYPAVVNQQGQTVDLYRDEDWCPDEHKPLLRSARAFRQELGVKSSVSAVCIFGYGIQTPVGGVLEERKQGGGWERLRVIQENRGDNTVADSSAFLPGAEIHPIMQQHGALYADNDVRVRLRMELTC